MLEVVTRLQGDDAGGCERPEALECVSFRREHSDVNFDM